MVNEIRWKHKRGTTLIIAKHVENGEWKNLQNGVENYNAEENQSHSSNNPMINDENFKTRIKDYCLRR